MKTVILLTICFLCVATFSFTANAGTKVEGDLIVSGTLFLSDGSPLTSLAGMLKNKGPWSSGGPYSEGDVVQYLGSSYVCNTANIDTQLPTTNWSILAAGSGGMLTNTEIFTCVDTNTCLCRAGLVVKALVSIACNIHHALNSSGLLNPEATGWKAECVYFEKQFFNGVLTDIIPVWSVPSSIRIACSTP